MLSLKLLVALIVSFLMLTLVAENTDAAPEPCKELLDMLMKPEKPEKPKKPKNDKDKPDNSDKPTKEIEKFEKVLEKMLGLK